MSTLENFLTHISDRKFSDKKTEHTFSHTEPYIESLFTTYVKSSSRLAS